MKPKSEQFQEQLNELEGAILNEIIGYFMDSKYGWYPFNERVNSEYEEILGIEIKNESGQSVFYARVDNERLRNYPQKLEDFSATDLLLILTEIENKRNCKLTLITIITE